MIETRGDSVWIGGLLTSELAEFYGEPLYIYDAELIHAQFCKLRAALPECVDVLYSLKANPNISIVSLLSQLTYGLDVSSLRELAIALHARVMPERIYFMGPAKSDEEIREAVAQNLGGLIAESEGELERINDAAGRLARQMRVGVRVNPAFGASGSKLAMGGAPRQFGIDEEQLVDVLARTSKALRNVTVVGLHAYVGTRILDADVAVKNTTEILALACRIMRAWGRHFEFVDFGGGLGVPYFPEEHPFDLEQFQMGMSSLFAQRHEQMPRTRFYMEAGRFLVAEAGIYVTRIRDQKSSRGKRFVLVSGGMNHHQATASSGSLLKQHFPIRALDRITAPSAGPAFVCGPLCTPGDVLGKAVELPDTQIGDLLGIMNSGAYGLTASPHEFLSHPEPQEVMVYRGNHYLIRKPAPLAASLQRQAIAPIKLESLESLEKVTDSLATV